MMIEFTMNNHKETKIAVNPDKVSCIYPEKGSKYDDKDGSIVIGERIDVTRIEFGSEEESVAVKELYPEVLHRLNEADKMEIINAPI